MPWISSNLRPSRAVAQQMDWLSHPPLQWQCSSQQSCRPVNIACYAGSGQHINRLEAMRNEWFFKRIYEMIVLGRRWELSVQMHFAQNNRIKIHKVLILMIRLRTVPVVSNEFRWISPLARSSTLNSMCSVPMWKSVARLVRCFLVPSRPFQESNIFHRMHLVTAKLTMVKVLKSSSLT